MHNIPTFSSQNGCVVLRRRPRSSRKGSILVLAAVFTVVVVALLALSIDLGYMMSVQTEMDRATDAAALAGAGGLIDGEAAAKLAALDVLLRNPVGSQVLLEHEDREAKLAAWLADHGDRFETQVGHWNPQTMTFSQTSTIPSAIHVTASYEHPTLYFANVFRLLGGDVDSFTVRSEAIARYQPRDIALVLDFSASMNDDSELQRIQQYGESVRATIVANIQQIYEDLGSPVYGTMTFDPVYISSTDDNTIKQTLGLRYKQGKKWKEVPYPYPEGSWNGYIDYMSNSYGYPARAGYYKKYGYLTLINYWLEQLPSAEQTPSLWQTSEQPVKALKDAVGVFMAYIQEVEDCDDQVGLVIYNSPSEDALIEHSLTGDFAAVTNTVQHRQAGHYDPYTNIGAGLREAWEELDAHGRIGAKKMIVLMTDGQANKPGGVSQARQYVLSQAAIAKGKHYQIFTISLGTGADADLMEEVAELTGGKHFNIPGGSTVTDYEAELLEAFRQIADARPLLLVK